MARDYDKEIEAAQKAYEAARQGQKAAQELRGFPGSKEAINQAARQMGKAEARIKRATAAKERAEKKGR